MRAPERKSKSESPDDVLTVAQAAALIGVTTQAVHEAINRERLPATAKLVEVRGVRRADAEAYREQRTASLARSA